MSELRDIFEPGDYVYIRDHAGGIFVYIVRPDGAIVLLQDPTGMTQ